MTRFVATRLALAVPTLIGVVLVVFGLLEIVPGDPAAVFLGENAPPDAVLSLRAELGLDRSRSERLVSYVSGIVRGDLGRSIFVREPVLDLVVERVPASLELALSAFSIALVFGVALGTLAALHQGRAVDVGLSVLAQLGVSMPVFWLGILLMAWLAVDWGWFPAVGRRDSVVAAVASGDLARIGEVLRYLALPAVTLGVHHAAVISRLVRASMLESLNESYVRSAHARGLTRGYVVRAHALRTALLPVLSVLGVRFGALLGGAVLTETIFGWPGLGHLAVTAISQRDLPLVQGIVLVFALAFILLNVCVDVLHASLDPRIRVDA